MNIGIKVFPLSCIFEDFGDEETSMKFIKFFSVNKFVNPKNSFYVRVVAERDAALTAQA